MKLRKGDVVAVAVRIIGIMEDGCYRGECVNGKNSVTLRESDIQTVDQTVFKVGDYVEGEDLVGVTWSGMLEYVTPSDGEDPIGLIRGLHFRQIVAYDTIRRIEPPVEPQTEEREKTFAEAEADARKRYTYFVRKDALIKGAYEAVRSDGVLSSDFRSDKEAHDWVRVNWLIDAGKQLLPLMNR